MSRQDAPAAGDRIEQLETKYSAPTPATRLRELLTQAGLSQRAAARELQVDERTVRYWCSGQLSVPRTTLLAVERIVESRHQLRSARTSAGPPDPETSSRIEALFTRLHTDEPSDEIRMAVIDLIAETLNDRKAALGYWEKAHLAEAIAAVGWNQRNPKPRHAWLHLALVSTDKAMVPIAMRDENYTRKDQAIDALSYHDLAHALRQLGANTV